MGSEFVSRVYPIPCELLVFFYSFRWFSPGLGQFCSHAYTDRYFTQQLCEAICRSPGFSVYSFISGGLSTNSSCLESPSVLIFIFSTQGVVCILLGFPLSTPPPEILSRLQAQLSLSLRHHCPCCLTSGFLDIIP